MAFRSGLIDPNASFNLNGEFYPNAQRFHYSNNASASNRTALPALAGRSFANQFKQVQSLENSLFHQKNANLSRYLPQLPNDSSQIRQECAKKKEQHEQEKNPIKSSDLKDKFDAIRQTKLVPAVEASPLEEEKKKLNDYMAHKDFKSSMETSLGQICQSIKQDLEQENKRSALMMNEIKKGLLDIKLGINSKLRSNMNEGNQTVKDINKAIRKEEKDDTRMKYLTDKIFPSTDREHESDEEYQKREEDNKKALIKLSPMSSQLSRRGNNEAGMLNINLIPIYNSQAEGKDKSIDHIDFRQIYFTQQLKEFDKVEALLSVSTSSKSPSFRPINKFRAYAYFIIAAKRLLNIQYAIYSTIKYDAVHSFIDNYEDMDIIFKKLMYNSIKPVFYEILHDKQLDINIAVRKPNAHSSFLVLKRVLEDIVIEGLSQRFYQGVSNDMLRFLSTLMGNYSYVPREFYATFELVRFRTTVTGELIELGREAQKMILGFYLIVKILLKNLFLELLFNQQSIKALERRVKLNIKMIVSVIYRGVMEEFKRCPTQRNANALEEPEDEMNYARIFYRKKSFVNDMKFRRVKKRKRKQDAGKKKAKRKRNEIHERDRETEQVEVQEETKATKAKLKKKAQEGQDNLQEDIEDDKKKKDIKQKKAKKKTKAKDTDGKKEDLADELKQKSSVSASNKLVNKSNISQDNEPSDEEAPKKKKKKATAVKKGKGSSPSREQDDQIEQNKEEEPEEAKAKPKRSRKQGRDKAKAKPSRREPNNQVKPPQHPNRSQVINTNKPSKRLSSSKEKSKPKRMDNERSPKKLKPVKTKPKPNKSNFTLKKRNVADPNQSVILLKQTQHSGKNQPSLTHSLPEFTEDETIAMGYILHNLPDNGEDSNPNEFELIDNVVYSHEFLQIYELFREEYEFDPIQPIMQFIDKLYNMIIANSYRE